MGKPRLLDLFCCEGGAGAGYARAGFEVTGVDVVTQPRYPFEFRQDSVANLDPAWIAANFDAVHASPPCQAFSEVTPDRTKHLNLIPITRALLKASGLPYVIENVRAARQHLIDPVSLFGTMFDCHVIDSQGRRFDLSRERLFETNWPLVAPTDPGPRHPIANVFGGHFRVRGGQFRTGAGTGRTVDLPGENRQALAKQIMGMPWATMQGCSEAVPPVFTEHIGRQLAAILQAQREAA